MESTSTFKAAVFEGHNFLVRIDMGVKIKDITGEVFYVWNKSFGIDGLDDKHYYVIRENKEMTVMKVQDMFIPDEDLEKQYKLCILLTKINPGYGDPTKNEMDIKVESVMEAGRRTFTPGRKIDGAKWDGHPIEATEMYVIIADSDHKYYWARGLVGMKRRAIRCVRDKQTWYLDNEDGQAFCKVSWGEGGLQFGHRTLYIQREEPVFVKSLLDG